MDKGDQTEEELEPPAAISEALGGSNGFYLEYFKSTSEEYRTTSAMTKYGGSFVKALAELYSLGDYSNKRKLITAFTAYFDEYKEIGEKWE